MLIDLAIETAVRAHRNQFRKGTEIPYIVHPLAVGIILAKAGCSDDVIAAGILHDTVEDTSTTLHFVREKFGRKIASIVEGCSEPDKSLPWEERKEHTIESLKSAPLEVRLVSCADKLHNLRTIVAEHSEIGDEIWKRFKRGRAEQEWYYRAMVEVLCGNTDHGGYEALFHQLRKEVERFFG